MSEFNFSIPGGESKRLKTAGLYCPADIVITAEGGSAPAGDWSDPDYVYAVTRPKDWLPMPTPGDDEMYLLNLIPEGLDGCFAAYIAFSGTCTVEFGNLVDGVFVPKESLTPTNSVRFYHTLHWDDYGDTTADNFRQYLVKISGKPTIIMLDPSQKGTYYLGCPYLVEVACGMKTNLSCASQTPSLACQFLKYVRFTGNGGLSGSNGQSFRGCTSLMSVSAPNQANGYYNSYQFENCKSLLAVSSNVLVPNIGHPYIFKSAKIPYIDGQINIKDSAVEMFRDSVSSFLFDGNKIKTSLATNFTNFMFNAPVAEVMNLDISSMTNATGMFSNCYLTKLTFAGETTPGGWTINLSSAFMSHKALVKMINSLPTALSPATIAITGNPGAADLTEEEIAVATAKNWTVTI